MRLKKKLPPKPQGAKVISRMSGKCLKEAQHLRDTTSKRSIGSQLHLTLNPLNHANEWFKDLRVFENMAEGLFDFLHHRRGLGLDEPGVRHLGKMTRIRPKNKKGEAPPHA